jgi:starch synthase
MIAMPGHSFHDVFMLPISKAATLPTIFTIHNGNYQDGSVGINHLIPPFNSANRGMLEWNKAINSMACAIKCCSRLTTVSPTYLEELRYYSQGLEPLFNSERQKSLGILNGIDTDVWNPETDTWIDAPYTSKNVTGGKRKNKESLCKSFWV